MKEDAFVGGVSLLLVAFLVVTSQTALAITRFGASSLGDTDAGGGLAPCSADVHTTIVPVTLGVDDGDTVRIWFNVSWTDNRADGSPQATHYFKVDWTHLANYDFADRLKFTDGGEGAQTENFYTDVFNVSDNNWLGITWFASATVAGSPSCYDDDTALHDIWLS